MIMNHFYRHIDLPKYKTHFNEFMINFHDYRHQKKNSIKDFVLNLKKKYKLIYLDEFQVTNIVDAMILGELFKKIFDEKLKILITSNTRLDDLYKDGLQRSQFIPFIKTIKNYSIEQELVIEDDYRKLGADKLQRAFHPINEKTTFKINKIFRELTKNKILKKKIISVKGRSFEIMNYYEGIAKFDFNQLCDVNLGAEDYIKISEVCNYIVIQNVPIFNDLNSNQQQRFIILIDILYEKKN